MREVKFVSKQTTLIKKISKLEKELQEMKKYFGAQRRIVQGNEKDKHEQCISEQDNAN